MRYYITPEDYEVAKQNGIAKGSVFRWQLK